MAVTLDATPGGASSNSYVTLAEADAYFETRLHSTRWTKGEGDDKKRALIAATSRFERLVGWFDGEVASSTQALVWPRSGVTSRTGAEISSTTIPEDLKSAICEYAFLLLTEERVGGRDVRSAAGEIQRVGADELRPASDPPIEIVLGVKDLGGYRRASVGRLRRT